MPKLKTHKVRRKRFRMTATGKIKRGHSHARHILTKKTNKRKRIWMLTCWSPMATSIESSECCRMEEIDSLNHFAH